MRQNRIHWMTLFIAVLWTVTCGNAMLDECALRADAGNITISGISFSSDTDCEGDGFAYDAEHNTLTLSDYEGAFIDIRAGQKITIALEGNNVLTTNTAVASISAISSICIVGDGSLELHANGMTTAIAVCSGGLSVTDATIVISDTHADISEEYLIEVESTAVFSNAKLTLEDISGEHGGAIWTRSGDISIQDGTIFNCMTNGYAIHVQNGALEVTGDGTSVVASGAVAGVKAHAGVAVRDSASLSVSTSGENAAILCMGGALSIDSAMVTASGAVTAVGATDIVMNNAYLQLPEDAVTAMRGDLMTVVSGDDASVASDISIVSGTAPTPISTQTSAPLLTESSVASDTDETEEKPFWQYFVAVTLFAVSLCAIVFLVVRKLKSK